MKTDQSDSGAGFPLEFLCTTRSGGTSVLAVVFRTGSPPSLERALECPNRLIALRAAQILQSAASSGRSGTGVVEGADELAADLPTGDAADFRRSLDRAVSGSWPITDTGVTVSWDDVWSATKASHDDATTTAPTGPLKEIDQPVVRVAQMSEWRIDDPERLVAAASSIGWSSPKSAPSTNVEGLFDTVDDFDLAGAVMWLTQHGPNVPGAHRVTTTTQGRLLHERHGDEISDWSSTSIRIDFGRGTRADQGNLWDKEFERPERGPRSTKPDDGAVDNE